MMKRRLDPMLVLGIEITAGDLGMSVFGVDLVGLEVSESRWRELTRRFRMGLIAQLRWPTAVLSASQAHDRVLHEYRLPNSQEDLAACVRFAAAHRAAEEYAFGIMGRPVAAFLDVKTLH